MILDRPAFIVADPASSKLVHLHYVSLYDIFFMCVCPFYYMLNLYTTYLNAISSGVNRVVVISTQTQTGGMSCPRLGKKKEIWVRHHCSFIPVPPGLAGSKIRRGEVE